MGIIDIFAAYLLGVKNRSKNTVAAYLRAVVEWESWHVAAYGAAPDYNTVGRAVVLAYVDALALSGKAPATRCQKISALKTFFRWLYTSGRAGTDVSDALELPALEQKAPRAMTKPEVLRVLSACQQVGKGESRKTVERNFVIFYTFLNCGLRKSELINLKVSDVDLQASRLLIHGKGNKQRFVYFNGELCSLLVKYLNVTRPNFEYSAQSEYLFVSTNSAQLTAVQISRIFDKVMQKSGLQDKGYTVHTLRKTCATLLYSGGVDVSTIKEFLGHSKVETTYIYLAIPEENKKRAGADLCLGL